MTDSQVHNNQEAGRYELRTPQGTAFALYHQVGGSIIFTHTEVPEEIEGQGVGSRLVKAALEDVKRQGKTVIPTCPFVAGYIGQHHEYLELVYDSQPGALEI